MIKLYPLILCCCLLTACSSNIKQHSDDRPANNNILVAPVNVHRIDSSLIVIDTASKLCWTKKDFSSIKSRYLKGWQEIFTWQKEMDSMGYAGYNDWRVPTINEYRTIDKNAADRKLYRKNFIEKDSTFVWGKGPYSFWSSTEPNKNTASYISFIDGFATSGDRGRQYASGPWKGIEFVMSVRLVRTVR